MGGVIEQRIKGYWSPLAFFSRHWSKADLNKSAFNKELWAIKTARNHFCHILESRRFHVLTDHKPLVDAIHKNEPNWSVSQQKAFSRIMEMTSDLRHLSGIENVVADALSRPPQGPVAPAVAATAGSGTRREVVATNSTDPPTWCMQ